MQAARTFLLLRRSHLMRFLAGAEEGDGGAIASLSRMNRAGPQSKIYMGRRSFLVVPAKLMIRSDPD
jgi:hypothetical protein